MECLYKQFRTKDCLPQVVTGGTVAEPRSFSLQIQIPHRGLQGPAGSDPACSPASPLFITWWLPWSCSFLNTVNSSLLQGLHSSSLHETFLICSCTGSSWSFTSLFRPPLAPCLAARAPEPGCLTQSLASPLLVGDHGHVA